MSDLASHTRLRRIGLLAAFVVPVLTACGGGSSGGASTEGPAPTPPPSPAPTTALSLLAGNNDGPGNQDGAASTTARLGSHLFGMAVASTGEIILADTGNQRIRKLSANLDQITTIAGGGVGTIFGTPDHADGTGAAARFAGPTAVAVDAAGNTYVADTDNHVVRKISVSGSVTTVAGQPGVCGNQDGLSSLATFCRPSSIAVDKAGTVYVSEAQDGPNRVSVGNPIRRISAAGLVSTLTSKASQYPTSFFISGPPILTYHPVSLALDSAGTLYSADRNDHVIRKYTNDGQAIVVSGTLGPNNAGDADGPAAAAKFDNLRSIAFDSADRLFVLDHGGSASTPKIRRIGSDGQASTLFGPQVCRTPYTPGSLCGATQMVVQPDGRFLVHEQVFVNSSDVVNSWVYAQLRSYTAQGASIPVAGLPVAPGASDGQGSSARFDGPGSIALNPAGTLYVRDSGNRTIRTVQADGLVRTLGKPGGHCTAITGNGSDVLASSSTPLATDSAGNLYSLSGTRVVKTSNCNAAILADLAPWLDKVPTALNSNLSGVAADGAGNVYVSSLKGAIFKIDARGEVTLFAGSAGTVGHVDGQGASAQFSVLGNMTTDAAGNLYVMDGLFYGDYNLRIGPTVRKITPSGMVSTLAGNPDAAQGFADGQGTAAMFTVNIGPSFPQQTAELAADAKGNIYVTDRVNSVVRKITPDGVVSTPIGQARQQGFMAGDLPGLVNSPRGIAVRGSMLYISVPHAVLQVRLP